MSINELGQILREMYSNASHGNQVVNIHLFGIKYAFEILRNKYSVKEIVTASGINTSYATEVSKGIRLSEYVILKN